MLKRVILSLVMACFLCTCIPSYALAASKIENESTVKVAWPLLGELSAVDANGNRCGYDYDYLQKIAQYTGWQYEFIEPEGKNLNERLSNSFDMLQKGEVDILGCVRRNSSTEDLYDFPSYNYGTAYTVLLVPNESTAFYNMDDLAQKQLSVALYSNAEATDRLLQQFCDANKVDLVTIPCQSEDDLLYAVKSGKADAMISSNLTPIDGMRTIARFGGEPYYFAVAKGKTEIKNALSSALFNINTANPYFDEDLYHVYFEDQASHAGFTSEERQYISDHPTLNVLISTQSAPFQYIDSNGNLTGVSKNVLDIISEQTGIAINYITTDNHDDFMRYLNEEKIDLIAGIPYNYDFGSAYNTVFTNPFASSPMTMILLQNAKSKPWGDAVLALPYGSFWKEQSKFKHVDFYNSLVECINAVESGKADFSYGNVYSMGYYMQYIGKNIIALPYPGETTDYCIGVQRPADINLISIMNKVILTIPDGDITTMLFYNTTNSSRKATLASFVISNPVESIVFVSMIALTIIMLITIILCMRISSSRQLRLDNERYLILSDMSNEYLFEYDREKDMLTLSHTCAELLGISTVISEYSKKLKTYVTDEETYNILYSIITNNGGESEAKLRTADGSMRWFSIVNACVAGSSKKRQYIIGKLVDIQDKKRETEILLEKSQKDALTGLYNVASCRDQVSEYLRSKPSDEFGAFLICDIDNFKEINDTFGHSKGDKVLILVSEILHDLFRQQDIIARVGGDEFVVFMRSVRSRETVVAKSAQLCEEIRQRLSYNGKEIRLTVSVGASITNDADEDYEALYRRADDALYKAKELGKDGSFVDGHA